MQRPNGDQGHAAFDTFESSPLAANLVGGARGVRTGRGYSRFVKSTKILLPLFALGLVGLIIAWPHLNGDDTLKIGFASVNLSDDADPGMDNARYMGMDEKHQPYTVTADLARIVGKGGDIIDLELPKADLTLKDGTWLVLTAKAGRYMRKPATLDLNGGVNLFHDTGYEITTGQLIVDLKAGSAEGNTPLSGHGPFGEIKAQGLKLIDKGRVIHFTGPAQIILYASNGAN